MMIDVPLTKAQAELRNVIDRYARRYGYTPTMPVLEPGTEGGGPGLLVAN